ncbi:hypothetical protein [Clostridium sardiniense]|uniref:hypothetical protein n=1 Tax=Clostridium sardiniense TaxID=29369 RepID=UPI003D34A8B3
MRKILLPEKAKVTPKEVLEEISKFDHINKSPYSSSYYNVPNVTWEYKPEGSLRISDHWNFMSHGEKHCILESTEEKIENNWILAKYIEGKYHILKEFGENVPGYRFMEINKNELELLKDLYDLGGLVSSKEWHKMHKEKIYAIKETHIKNRKKVLKDINPDKLKEFKEKNKKVKKVVYIRECDLYNIKLALTLYKISRDLDELCKSKEGTSKLINKYKGYRFNDGEIESFEEKYILVLDNKIAVDFSKEYLEEICKVTDKNES